MLRGLPAHTHADPTYTVHDSVFLLRGQHAGAVPRTSTYALTNVALPYLLALADLGWRRAMRADQALSLGLNTYDGQVTCGPVAEAHGMVGVARRAPDLTCRNDGKELRSSQTSS